MSDVKITSVRAIATAPQGSNLIIVRIDTNQPGLYGYGCATYTQRFTPVLTVINDYMGKLLIGHDALNVNDAWEHMMNSSYWRNGPVLNNAISGVDDGLRYGPVGYYRQGGEYAGLAALGRQGAPGRAGLPPHRQHRL